MEKGEGIGLKKQFAVRAFPTFFIIRPDGTVQHRLAGGSQWERFRERVARGLEETTSYAYLNERYQQGKLARKQYPHYVQALKDAGDRPAVKNVCMEVFGQPERQSEMQCRKLVYFRSGNGTGRSPV